MAQKINPISLRLQYTNRYFDNSWYSKYYYDKLVTRDIYIQKYINTFLKLLKLPLGRFSIQHLPKKTRIFSFFCYPKISRNIRSKMFGVYSPFFFRKKKIIRKKKWNPFNSSKYSKNANNLIKRNLKSINKTNLGKTLYNKNLWFSVNCYKTNKNLFWINHLYYKNKKHFIPSKLASNQDNTFYLINSYKQKNILENDKKIKNINDFYLKFFINIIIKSNLKKEKKRKDFKQNLGNYSKNNFILKLNLFKFFLMFNNYSKNIWWSKKTQDLENQNKQVMKSPNIIFIQNLKKFKLFNTKLQDYLNKTNLIHIEDNKYLKKSSININKKKKKIDLTKKLTIFSKFSDLEILKTSSEPNIILPKSVDLCKELDFYNPNIIQNNPNFLLSNKWKLNNIENKSKYKSYIQRSLANIYNIGFEFIPLKIKNDWQSAGFLADEIVYFLERRVPFRRIKNRILKQISENSNIRGIRITCSGRVGGKSKKAQRAKTECVKLGQTSLHIFSSKIDFAIRTAQTSFGSVGVKVWICYN